jgi:hypothetical protein
MWIDWAVFRTFSNSSVILSSDDIQSIFIEYLKYNRQVLHLQEGVNVSINIWWHPQRGITALQGRATREQYHKTDKTVIESTNSYEVSAVHVQSTFELHKDIDSLG